MLKQEWALFVFTLLIQFALGAVILAAFLPLRLKGSEKEHEVDWLSRSLLLVAAPLAVLGILFSFFHLGSPLGGYRAILNLKSSWLSREILFSGLFTLLAIVSAVQARKSRPSAPLTWVTLVVGLGSLFSMAKLYQATIMPAWTTFFTPLSFVTATVMLGVVAGAVLLLAGWQKQQIGAESAASLLRGLVVLGGLALVLQLAAIPFYTGLLAGGPVVAQDSLALLTGGYKALLAVRIAVGILGVALLSYGWLSLSRDGAKPSAGAAWVYLSVVGLAGAEVMARLLFYAVGLPMHVG